jgi:hypothetical protein
MWKKFFEKPKTAIYRGALGWVQIPAEELLLPRSRHSAGLNVPSLLLFKIYKYATNVRNSLSTFFIRTGTHPK